MDIHWLQHVPFEGLGCISSWAEKKHHNLLATRLWAGDRLPSPARVRMLLVMGGPMGVYDEGTVDWLTPEKQFISQVIQNGCPAIGICLGAQLIAEVVGAEVYRNPQKEIGWFPVESVETAPPPFSTVFPREMNVLHWHGDTFDVPPGGILLGSSKACVNQAYMVEDRILGLQYHLEMTPAGLHDIVSNCRHELVRGAWIQTEQQIIQNSAYLQQCNVIMERILNAFENIIAE